tara:strand:- start:845 stop:1327 length:483 start_codon:yes stop_codon:yes gene_type:complete
MSSASSRFTRLEKICVFLLAMGKERSREILADMDLNTIQKINITITSLGAVTAREKAAVMIEFGDFFYKDIPLSSKLKNSNEPMSKQGIPTNGAFQDKSSANLLSKQTQDHFSDDQKEPDEDKIVSKALDSFKLYAPKINWSNAGYDFGEGYRGLDEKNR